MSIRSYLGSPFRCVTSVLLAAVFLAAALIGRGLAQEVTISPSASPQQAQAIRQQLEAARRNANPAPQNSNNKKNDKKEEKPDQNKKNDDDKKKKDDDSVKRSDTPANEPDPRELEISLDEHGRVPPFSFIGQPWPDVLQWVAKLSNHSLDWQELPSGYLNLMTDRSLSPPEVRDRINRALHARGYTLLLKDNMLSVFKFDQLDPSLIPKIDNELDLYELQPHDFVKFAFKLPDELAVDKAVEDFKQLLSPHCKVFPMVTSHHVLVIDMVANLRFVSEVLNEERTAAMKLENIQEFRLKSARADEVIEMVYLALGMDPNNQNKQMELAIKQQQMQLAMQLQKKGKDVSKMLDDEPPVHLVFNRRHNSIIANAPPKEMRIITETIRIFDVPPAGATAESKNPAAGPSAGDLTVQQYRLVTMDPEALKRVLEEIGNLDPFTRLDAVKGSKMLFARATQKDHQTIQAMMEELDGTGRNLYVVRLRHKAADVVAAGIFNLMVGEEADDEPKDDIGYYYYYRYGQQEEPKTKDGFRIYADVESNSLWLWANESEMKAVDAFLAKLGEVRNERVADQAVRTLDAFGAESTEELIERLKKAWSGRNPINVIAAPPADTDDEADDEKDDEEQSESPSEDRTAGRPAVRAQLVQFNPPELEEQTADDVDDTPEPPSAPTGEPPPINIAVTPDGRLVLSSTDGEAVSQLEQLATDLMPPPERFRRIPLNHISAETMASIMGDVFEDEMYEGGSSQPVRDWYTGRWVQSEEQQKDFRISRRATLKFDWDQNGNALIVINATPRQWYEIKNVVAMYDLPTEYDPSLMLKRRTELIRIKYSRASTIADAVKDAYRDLLSQSDEALQSENNGENGQRTTLSRTRYWSIIRYGGPGDGTPGDQESKQLPARFDGALSLGVDDIANVIIVSAREELFDSVRMMIRQLDEEAKPETTVAVHRIGGALDSEQLQETLANLLGTPWVGNRPEQAQQQRDNRRDDERRRQRDRRRQQQQRRR